MLILYLQVMGRGYLAGVGAFGRGVRTIQDEYVVKCGKRLHYLLTKVNLKEAKVM